MLCRCTFTVPSEIDRRVAMARLRSPSATIRTISCAVHDFLIEPLAAVAHAPHAPDERVRRRVLHHQPRHAEPHGFGDLRIVDCGRQQHRAARDPGVGEIAEELQAVGAGHAEIEDEDVRRLPPDGLHGAVGIGTGRQDGEIRLALQQLLQAAEDNRMIVDEYQAHAHGVRPL